VPTAHISTR